MAFEFFELSRILGFKIALYRFQCGPVVERFTSSGRDRVVAGNLYKAARGISHTAVRESSRSDKANQVTITFPYLLDAAAPDFPVTQSLGNWWRPFPPSERVLVTVASTHLGDPDEEVNIEWIGRVIGPAYGRATMDLICDPSFRSGKMSGSIPRLQRNCGVALYSQGLGMCNLQPEPFRVVATVTAVDGNDVTVDAIEDQPRTFVGGKVRWVRGEDDDAEWHQASIITRDGNTITVDDAGDLAEDDEVVLYTIPYWFEAELTAVDGAVITAAELATAAKPLPGGMVKWTRPDGRIETRTIMSHDGSDVRLQYGGVDLASGLVVQVYPGCAHNEAACEEHGNSINYPGWKHLPTEDPMPRSMAW